MAGYNAERVSDLAQKVMHHKRLYYSGEPAISDTEFDRLEDELRHLDPKHPALSFVGTDQISKGPKVEHAIPMLSLQKVYKESELLSWMNGRQAVGSWKVDGNSLSLIYKKGELVQAKTRGNGRLGENVTATVRWVADLVPKVQEDWNFEVRGELYCSEDQFALLTDEMLHLGLERPNNPRNIVAGILGRKSHSELSRFFNFFAFDLLVSGDRYFETEMDKLKWLQSRGFKLPSPRLIESEQALQAFLEEVKGVMAEGQIGIDGAVFSYNDLSLQDELGSTSHHPRYKMSFKWQGATKKAVITQFTWATSRHGIVTPVAVIDPVTLSGANITNITLHNAQFVKTYDLNIGDEIEIIRSGEVIPKFLRVVRSSGEGHVWIDFCPSCKAGLEFDGVRLICPNLHQCPAQREGAILNWIRYAQIDDLSEKRLQSMTGLGLVTGIADLYRLSVEDLMTLPLTKEKMAKKLFQNIAASRHLPLYRFLAGLGVPGMGLTSWEKLVEHHPGLDEVLSLDTEKIVQMDGFAEKTAGQIVRALQDKRGLIAELLEVGVRPEVLPLAAKATRDGALVGKAFVITGKLSQTRDAIVAEIKKAGGTVQSAVSKNTFAVITGDPESSSTKMKKARSLGVAVWSEKKLAEEIEG